MNRKESDYFKRGSARHSGIGSDYHNRFRAFQVIVFVSAYHLPPAAGKFCRLDISIGTSLQSFALRNVMSDRDYLEYHMTQGDRKPGMLNIYK